MKVAIIGCGYIGYELAKDLYEKDYTITCTTKNPKSIEKLKKTTQKSIIMYGHDRNEMEIILNENDVIIITIAASSSDEFESTYLQTAKTIKACTLETASPKTIIYTSKTSIYGNHNGMWVNEASTLNAKDDDAKILIDTEDTLSSLTKLGYKICILRLAQIYGPGREIKELFKALYKDVLPGHGDYYTNMVHQKDVVKAIAYVIEHKIEGVYNIADDDHPTRQEFANLICSRLKLNPPKYDPKLADLPDRNKRVSNYRIKEEGFEFTYPNRSI